MNTYTRKIEKSEVGRIRAFFEKREFEFSDAQYAVFKAKSSIATVTLYESGKIVIQGKEIDSLVAELEGKQPDQKRLFANQPQQTSQTINDSNIFTEHIGVDESGKGDFFGPLVIAGVLATSENAKRFIEEGIKDSKKLTDEKILKLSGIIKANSVHSVVVIGNEKYNELYTKFANLNKLLAWGHARVIENILEKTPCQYALSDKFGNESLIQNALMQKGQNIKLEQRVRGEEDIAVAAASVLARAEYVKRMDSLSHTYELDLPKGASDKVVTTAKEFAKRYGKEKLKSVSKTHFKTFSNI